MPSGSTKARLYVMGMHAHDTIQKSATGASFTTVQTGSNDLTLQS